MPRTRIACPGRIRSPTLFWSMMVRQSCIVASAGATSNVSLPRRLFLSIENRHRPWPDGERPGSSQGQGNAV